MKNTTHKKIAFSKFQMKNIKSQMKLKNNEAIEFLENLQNGNLLTEKEKETTKYIKELIQEINKKI